LQVGEGEWASYTTETISPLRRLLHALDTDESHQGPARRRRGRHPTLRPNRVVTNGGASPHGKMVTPSPMDWAADISGCRKDASGATPSRGGPCPAPARIAAASALAHRRNRQIPRPNSQIRRMGFRRPQAQAWSVHQGLEPLRHPAKLNCLQRQGSFDLLEDIARVRRPIRRPLLIGILWAGRPSSRLVAIADRDR
jgi:hypothetical protein